jgi:phenylacetate-CoA ligase
MLYQIERSQWDSPEAIAQAQFRQLRELVPYAVRHVPYYGRSLAKFAQAESITTESWVDVPILARANAQQAGADLVSQAIPREHGNVHTVKTSGSTGIAVQFKGTDLTQFFWRVFALREHLWHQRDFDRTLMAIRFVSDNSGTPAEGVYTPGWGAATEQVVRTGDSATYSILRDISYLAARLLADQPGYLLTHPSVLGALLDHFERQGQRPRGLVGVRTMGESLPEHLRESCQRAWGVPLVDMYTCQEAGYLAAQCPAHDHYHVQSENVLLEVVDAQGRACAPGTPGRVLITSLNNFATPLIRYELGDYAEWGERCTCGRGLRVLRRVVGRYRGLLTLPSGEQRWPRMGYQGLRQAVPCVQQIQIVQQRLDELEVRVVAAEPLTPDEFGRLSAYLHANLGHTFKLRFEQVAELRSAVNGKVEQFISRLAPDQLPRK